MHAHQRGAIGIGNALDQRQMLAADRVVAVDARRPGAAILADELFFLNLFDQDVGATSIGDQVGDRADV